MDSLRIVCDRVFDLAFYILLSGILNFMFYTLDTFLMGNMPEGCILIAQLLLWGKSATHQAAWLYLKITISDPVKNINRIIKFLNVWQSSHMVRL